MDGCYFCGRCGFVPDDGNELQAIVEMVQYSRCYLWGVHFNIRTDHDSLKGVKQLDKLTGQMAWWIEYLEGFRF